MDTRKWLLYVGVAIALYIWFDAAKQRGRKTSLISTIGDAYADTVRTLQGRGQGSGGTGNRLGLTLGGYRFEA